MANTVALTYQMFLRAVETLDLDEDQASDPNLTHQITGAGNNSQKSLGAATTPAISKIWSDYITLTAGDLSLDLTALTRVVLPTVDMSGLKVQAVMIECDSTNTAVVIFKPHASNGYNLFGDADGQVSLGANEKLLKISNENMPDVANGSADIVHVTSTDADAKFRIIIAAG